MADASEPSLQEDLPPAPLRDDEFYLDGPLFVFTAAYHRRRGFCCGNGCRHCPYDENGEPVPGKGE